VVKLLRSLAVIAITGLLLFLVFRKVGLEELAATLRQADMTWVVISFLLIPVINLVNVMKWNTLLRSQGIEVPLLYQFKLYFIGYFFNNFLPTNVGGDVVRIYELGNRTKDPAGAAAAVFMERLTGFVVLFVFAFIALALQPTMAEDPWLKVATVMVAAMFVAVIWLILDPRILDLIDRTIHFKMVQKYTAKFRKFHNSVQAYQNRPGTLALAMFWSVIFYFMAVLNTYASAMAFYQPIPFWGIAAITPIIGVVSVLPLTFNSVGIQEWAYVLLFSWLGLPPSVGLSTILLIRAKILFVATIGGLLYGGSKMQVTVTARSG
jgi:uncharacterized protein (TIRG00374 family)